MAEVTTTQNPLAPRRGKRVKGEGGRVVATIGVGSNVGDRKLNILRALNMLTLTRGIHVSNVSTLVETKALGPIRDQPDFLNGVVKVETVLSPFELLDQLLFIEARLGRVRHQRLGPRIIDLDILLYGDETIDHPRLKIPHPEILHRPFVQAALVELQQQTPSPCTLSPKGARGIKGDKRL